MMRVLSLALFLGTATAGSLKGISKPEPELDFENGEIMAVVEPGEEVYTPADLGFSHRDLKTKSKDSADINGELGQRKQCNGVRTTMICKWGADGTRRGLQEQRDRKLGVVLRDIECTLGVGIKPPESSKSSSKSSSSSGSGSGDEAVVSDYVEYKDTMAFPDPRWELRERVINVVDADGFGFITDLAFGPNGDGVIEIGGEQVTIRGSISLYFVTTEVDKEKFIFYDGVSASFGC